MLNRFLFFSVLVVLSSCSDLTSSGASDELFLTHEVSVSDSQLAFYLKDKKGDNFGSIGNLKKALEEENKTIIFAVNGGMYNQARAPQGLYVENGKVIQPLDTSSNGYGNFYLQPNGVFYIDKENRPEIRVTSSVNSVAEMKFATQSGPMLLIDGEIHSAFQEGSDNINIRNGVGILPNGHLLFVMSNKAVNFYDFALFFKENGCKKALYLDGYVSRTYLPAKGKLDLGGDFGVIIAELE